MPDNIEVNAEDVISSLSGDLAGLARSKAMITAQLQTVLAENVMLRARVESLEKVATESDSVAQ